MFVTSLALVVVLSSAAAGGAVSADSFYSMKTTTLDGKPADLGQYGGKVTLVVNVASQCGLHPAVRGPAEALRRVQGQGLRHPRLPEQRLRQPGARVARGDRHLLQEELRRDLSHVLEARDQGRARAVADLRFLGQSGSLPGWNFAKYLVGKDGKVVQLLHSKVTPEAKELRDAIDAALAK